MTDKVANAAGKKFDVIWQPHPGAQTYALQRDEFEVLYGGARGGGKTDAGLARILRDIDNPAYRVLVIRKNSIDLDEWLDRAKRMYAGTGAKFVGTPTRIIFPSGAQVTCGHLKDKNAYEKYQGKEFQLIVIEELTQIPEEKFYEQLIQSCRSSKPGLTPHVFMTTNPGGVGHGWVKKRFIAELIPNQTYWYSPEGSDKYLSQIFVPARLQDNPSLMQNDPMYLTRLQAIKDDKLRRAWLDGDWDVFAGQYFHEFLREVHVIKQQYIPKDWRRYISIDYGYRAPSAIYWHAVNYDGEVFTYRELYVTNHVYKDLATRIQAITEKANEKIEYAVIDPAVYSPDSATGESGAETMQRHMPNIPLQRADNSRIIGWNRMREYLAPYKRQRAAKWKILDCCVNLIRTLPTLMYDDRNVEDIDTTQEDHAADSCRYFFMSRPMNAEVERKDLSRDPTIDSYFEKAVSAVAEPNSWDEY